MKPKNNAPTPKLPKKAAKTVFGGNKMAYEPKTGGYGK